MSVGDTHGVAEVASCCGRSSRDGVNDASARVWVDNTWGVPSAGRVIVCGRAGAVSNEKTLNPKPSSRAVRSAACTLRRVRKAPSVHPALYSFAPPFRTCVCWARTCAVRCVFALKVYDRLLIPVTCVELYAVRSERLLIALFAAVDCVTSPPKAHGDSGASEGTGTPVVITPALSASLIAERSLAIHRCTHACRRFWSSTSSAAASSHAHTPSSFRSQSSSVRRLLTLTYSCRTALHPKPSSNRQGPPP